MKSFSLPFPRIVWGAIVGLSLLAAVSCKHDTTVSEAEIASLQQRLDSISLEYDKLRTAGSEYAGALSARDSMIQAQTEEIQSLILQLRRARASAAAPTNANADALREKNAQIAQMRTQLEVQSRQLKKLESAAQNSQTETSTVLQSQIEQYKSQIAQQERQIADLNRQVASINGQMGERDNTIATLQSEKDALSQQVKDLEKSSAALAVRLSELSAGSADAQQLAVCQRQLSQLQGEADGLRSQVGALQGQLQQRGNDAQQVVSLNQQVADLTGQVAGLQQQLSMRDAQLAAMEQQQSAAGESNQDAVAQIAALQQQVTRQQSEIERLNGEVRAKSEALRQAEAAAAAQPKPAATAATANKKLSELQAMCESYAQEIEQLRAENARLYNENEQLRTEMAQVQRDAEKALTDNSKLEQKVAMASILIADGLTATPAKSVSGTNIKTTEKASQVTAVRIDGRLLDNNVIDPGTVTLYARIATANNRIVSNGTPADFDMQGTPMQYTMSQDIEFTGASRKVTMVWRKLPATEMGAGLYWVTLYANGNEIGKTSFLLK